MRVLILLVLIAVQTVKATDCGVDGNHNKIDIKQLQIPYDGVSVRGMFEGLVKLGIEIEPAQTAAAETQKVNQYLQALVVGYNDCAITKQQYSDGTKMILGAKQDLISIDFIRSQLAEGQKGLEIELKGYLQSYLKHLAGLAALAGLRDDVERLTNEVDDIKNQMVAIRGELDDQREKEAETEAKRRTAPVLDAWLSPVSANSIKLVVSSTNNIPFEYRFSVVDDTNSVVCPLQLGFEKFYPDNSRNRATIPLELKLAPSVAIRRRIVLDFYYKSLSFDELHLAGHSGRIEHVYWLSPDGRSWYKQDPKSNDFPVGSFPDNLLFDGSSIWVANSGDGTITELRSTDGTEIGTFTAGSGPQGIAFDGANIWATDSLHNRVVKLRRGDGAIIGTFPVGSMPTNLIAEGSSIWVANAADGTLTKLRATDGRNLGTFPVGSHPMSLVYDGADIWIVETAQNSVRRIRAVDGSNNGVFAVGPRPIAVAFDGSAIWVVTSGDNSVVKLRVSDGFIVGKYSTGGVEPQQICTGGGYIWIAHSSGTVMKLFANDGAVSSILNVGPSPTDLIFDGTYIWATHHRSNSVSRR